MNEPEPGSGGGVRLLLVRHGATRWNEESRLQGWCDQDLSPAGRRQAEALRERLAAEAGGAAPTEPAEARVPGNAEADQTATGTHEAGAAAAAEVPPRPTVLWSSDLRRARTTAGVVFPGLDPRLDERLRELHLGDFEGATHDENLARHPDLYGRWLEDPWGSRPPGGESLTDLLTRVRDWLATVREEAVEDGPGVGVAAVTHAGPICTILSLAREISFDDAWAATPPPGEAVHVTLGPHVP